ncbi:hypothetical protein OUZ56_004313 [Daphnia magna]|uniref:Uncharacterized protein n=1 Tax=Daphnia magna TaxID=35525 RepID=A0ABQ9YPE3_9CRUS|nr:hypothetical protein OUZ56_004313 [Daphnia magna]
MNGYAFHCADCEAQMLKWTAACQAFARKSPSSDCRSNRYIASIDCPNDAGSAKTRIQPRKKQETKQTRKKTATLGENDDDGQGRDANSRGSKSFLLITQVSLAIGSDSVWPPRPMESFCSIRSCNLFDLCATIVSTQSTVDRETDVLYPLKFHYGQVRCS